MFNEIASKKYVFVFIDVDTFEGKSAIYIDSFVVNGFEINNNFTSEDLSKMGTLKMMKNKFFSVGRNVGKFDKDRKLILFAVDFR